MEEHKGRVNMETMLERKPLHPAEQEAAPATVCVTGAAGFIGARVVARLLAFGHTVHATRRAAGDNEAVTAALDALPAASERLRWFSADLMQEGSYDAAVAGCKYVIHSAGVVALTVPPKHGFARVIQPTLVGVENVLRSVERTPSVEKVVMTSSMAAVSGGFNDRGEGHLYSERDWNFGPLQTGEPYFVAKVAAEWQAWAMAGQQKRWQLVTILPGNTYGPLLAPIPDSAALTPFKRLMDGAGWPFIAPLGLLTVDLDDVAAAHVLAMVKPEAQGRYIVCERATLMTEVAACLREMYPRHWVPYIPVPAWVTAIVLWGNMSYSWIKQLWNKRAEVDTSKVQVELGLSFIPLEKTMKDMMDRWIELGALPRMPEFSHASLPLPLGGMGHTSELAGATATVTAKVADVAAKAKAAAGVGHAQETKKLS